MDDMEPIISWQAPEYNHREKTSSWYLWSLVGALVVAAIAVYQKNFMFALFVVIAEAMILFLSRQQPKLVTYSISIEGVHRDPNVHHRFSEMSAFAVTVFEEGTKRYGELVLRPTKKISSYIKILFPHEKADEMHELLSQHLTEFEYQEHVSGVLARWLGL